MKKFTKLFVGVFCAVLLATSAFAADAVKATPGAPVAVQTVTTSPSLFNAGEVGLSLGSAYTMGRASSLSGGTFNQSYTLNANGGAFWYPFRNLGVEANVPFYQTKGVSVDEVQAGLLLRLPLAKSTPVFRNLAPYVGLGGAYNWQSTQEWSYIAKAGLEVRLNKHWGIFGEGQYRNFECKNWGNGETSLNGGLKLVF